MTTYYRIINEHELRQIRNQGQIDGSLCDWHRYAPGEKVFVFSCRDEGREKQYVEDRAEGGRRNGALHPYQGPFFLISWHDPSATSYSSDDSADGWPSAMVASAPVMVRQLGGTILRRYDLSANIFPKILDIVELNEPI